MTSGAGDTGGTGATPPPAQRQQARGRTSPGIAVGRFFGVPVYFAPSWFVIAGIITFTYASLFADAIDDLGSTGSYLVALLFAVLLAASVLVHELGHVAISLLFGLPVRRVVIFLLGGVSEIADEPKRARHEFLIAAAGPAVSVLIASICRLTLPLTDSGSVTAALLSLLFWANAGIAVFNLLPGLPLDGGRLLRAVVWGAAGNKLIATKVAAWAGRVLAVALVIGAVALAVLGSDRARGDIGMTVSVLVTGLIALFIWSGATSSLRAVRVQQRAATLQLSTLVRPAQLVPADTPLAAVEGLRHAAVGIVVVDGHGVPRGVLDPVRIDSVPERQRPWVTVAEIAAALPEAAFLAERLSGPELIAAVRAHPAREYVVRSADGTVIGTLLADDLGRALVGR